MMEKEYIKALREKVNVAVSNHKKAIENNDFEVVSDINNPVLYFANRVMVAQKNLIIALQNELRNCNKDKQSSDLKD